MISRYRVFGSLSEVGWISTFPGACFVGLLINIPAPQPVQHKSRFIAQNINADPLPSGLRSYFNQCFRRGGTRIVSCRTRAEASQVKSRLTRDVSVTEPTNLDVHFFVTFRGGDTSCRDTFHIRVSSCPLPSEDESSPTQRAEPRTKLPFRLSGCEIRGAECVVTELKEDWNRKHSTAHCR